MRKLILSILFIANTAAFSQNENLEKEVGYSRWSIELNAGQNKAVKPFASGYYSADPSKVAALSSINHFDIGVRYMLSNSFGLKLDFAQDQFKDLAGAQSLPFDTQQNRIGLQGVMNLGHLLNFQSFSNCVGLLLHGGVQLSNFTVNSEINNGVTEKNGGVIFGATPQIRLKNWLALTADFTIVNNVRQHLNWDGSGAATNDNLSGVLYSTSLGLTFYLGKKEKHADWYTQIELMDGIKEELENNKNELEGVKTLMNDTDKDGVPDYLDQENNTPAGISVDTRGKFIDTNKNGVPDEMERSNTYTSTTSSSSEKVDAVKTLLENGYVNIFFDVNKDTPNSGSTNNILYIIRFLRENPEISIKLTGYADKRGNESLNKDLSVRRAQAIFNILTNSGIDNSKITITGAGVDDVFMSDNDAALDIARRVSISLK